MTLEFEQGKTHLNVFNVVVEQQLDKDRNHVLLADELPVQFLLGEDVECADRALDDLLHADAVGVGARRLGTVGRDRGALLKEGKREFQI